MLLVFVVALCGLALASPPGCVTRQNCGVHGHDIGGKQNTDLVTCEAECAANPECKFFVFRTKTNRCGFKGGGMILDVPGRPNICGECQATTAAPTAQPVAACDVAEPSISATGNKRCLASKRQSQATTQLDCACACQEMGFNTMFWKADSNTCHCPTANDCVAYGSDGRFAEFEFEHKYMYNLIHNLDKQIESLTDKLTELSKDVAAISGAAPEVPDNMPVDGCFESGLKFERPQFVDDNSWTQMPDRKVGSEHCIVLQEREHFTGTEADAYAECLSYKGNTCNAVYSENYEGADLESLWIKMRCEPDTQSVSEPGAMFAHVTDWQITIKYEGQQCPVSCGIGECDGCGTAGLCCGSDIEVPQYVVIADNKKCANVKPLEEEVGDLLFSTFDDCHQKVLDDPECTSKKFSYIASEVPGTRKYSYCFCALDDCQSMEDAPPVVRDEGSRMSPVRVYQQQVVKHPDFLTVPAYQCKMYFNGVSAATVLSAETIEDCAEHCRQTKFCRSAQFESDTKKCSMLNTECNRQALGGSHNFVGMTALRLNRYSSCTGFNSHSGMTCVRGVHAKVSTPTYDTATTITECQAACYKADNCKYFNWVPSMGAGQRCELVSEYYKRTAVAGVTSGPSTCWNEAFNCDNAGKNRCPLGKDQFMDGITRTTKELAGLEWSYTMKYQEFPGNHADYYPEADPVLVCYAYNWLLRRGDGLYLAEGPRPSAESDQWRLVYPFDKNSPKCPYKKLSPYAAPPAFEMARYKLPCVGRSVAEVVWQDCNKFYIRTWN